MTRLKGRSPARSGRPGLSVSSVPGARTSPSSAPATGASRSSRRWWGART